MAAPKRASVLGQVKFGGNLETFLPRLPLFKGVEPLVVRALAAKLKVLRFAPGETLPPQDEVHESCWIVLEGLIERRVIAANGRIVAVDMAGSGDLFGSLFQCCPVAPPIESVALAATAVGRIVTRDVRPILERSPAVIENLLDLLKASLDEARALRAMTAEPASRRILWALMWLYSKLGAELPLTRANLAEVAGLTRETAIRELSPLEKQGALRTHRGNIRILEPQAIVERLRASAG